MKPELQTIIKQYNALPEPIQQTIFYGDVTKVVGEIGNAYGLTPDQIVALENEVTLVLLLLQPHGDLKSRLTSAFGLTESDATSVVFLLDSLLIVPTFSRINTVAPAATYTTPQNQSPLPNQRTMASDQASSNQSHQGLDQDSLLKR